MTRILFDQNVPVGLRRHLPYEVSTAYENGWHELRNGELLAAAERAGFEIFLTCDQSIRHQQNLAGRTIGVVVLLTNHRNAILRNVAPVLRALANASSGSYHEVL
jgi:predicted nuclease of predicted toxin-antitoxin system